MPNPVIELHIFEYHKFIKKIKLEYIGERSKTNGNIIIPKDLKESQGGK